VVGLYPIGGSSKYPLECQVMWSVGKSSGKESDMMESLQLDAFVKVRKTLSFYEKLVVLQEILEMVCICKVLTLRVDEVRTFGP
jgi:hypothetical protein